MNKQERAGHLDVGDVLGAGQQQVLQFEVPMRDAPAPADSAQVSSKTEPPGSCPMPSVCAGCWGEPDKTAKWNPADGVVQYMSRAD